MAENASAPISGPTLSRARFAAMRELDAWRPHFEKALAEDLGEAEAHAVCVEAHARFVELLGKAPDPGALAPHMRAFSISGAMYVAMYLVLKAHGNDAAQAWAVCEKATRARFAAMSSLEKTLASSGMFGWPMKALSRWIAKRSQRAPVGGWVFSFVEGEKGQHDYGVNYERCAIRELAVANGAAEFAPYICLADVPGSEMFGWGLVRTETIAQGGARCDFRFRRGGPTDVKVHLPVV
jgi:hypothetical protein